MLGKKKNNSESPLLKDKKISVIDENNNVYFWDNKKFDFYLQSKNEYNSNNNEFLNDVKNALIYLNSSDYAAIIIDAISNSKDGVTIRQSNITNSNITDAGFEINYNPFLTTNVGDGTFSWESPALNLFHELAHSYEYLITKNLETNYKNTNVDPKWKNLAEKNAVIRTNAVAIQLGEPIRLDYISGLLIERNIGQDSYKFFNNNQKGVQK